MSKEDTDIAATSVRERHVPPKTTHPQSRRAAESKSTRPYDSSFPKTYHPAVFNQVHKIGKQRVLGSIQAVNTLGRKIPLLFKGGSDCLAQRCHVLMGPSQQSPSTAPATGAGGSCGLRPQDEPTSWGRRRGEEGKSAGGDERLGKRDLFYLPPLNYMGDGTVQRSTVSQEELPSDIFHGKKFLNNSKSKFVVSFHLQMPFSLPIALTIEQSRTGQGGIYFSPY